MRWLALALCLAACTPKANDPTEDACKLALEQLKAEKSAGASCPAARERAQSAFPACKLVFLCKGEGR